MDGQKYYNEILNDTSTFDKLVVHMENMIKNAPNARIRTQAERTLQDVNLILAICEELNKRNQ